MIASFLLAGALHAENASQELPADAGYNIPAVAGPLAPGMKGEGYSFIALRFVSSFQRFSPGSARFTLADLGVEYSCNGGQLDQYFLKLAFDRGTFDREARSYKVKSVIQLSRLNFCRGTSGNTIWRELDLETADSYRYDLGSGKSLDLRVLRDGAGKAVSLKITGRLNNYAYGEKIYSCDALREDWQNGAAAYPMFDKDKRRWYALPETFWVGGSVFRHGYVLGDENAILSPRTGVPLDFVELCRGDMDKCGSAAPVLSLATGLKFTPFEPAWESAWKVENMTMAEMQAAIEAELGPEEP